LFIFSFLFFLETAPEEAIVGQNVKSSVIVLAEHLAEYWRPSFFHLEVVGHQNGILAGGVEYPGPPEKAPIGNVYPYIKFFTWAF